MKFSLLSLLHYHFIWQLELIERKKCVLFKLDLMLNKNDIDFYLNIFKGLNLADIAALAKMGSIKKIRAGTIYIAEGSRSQRLAYIQKGLIRVYRTKENGDEITLMIRWEKQFVASIDSIVMQRSARFLYQALEDTIVLELDYGTAKAIIDQNPRLSAYRTDILLQMIAQAMDRIEAFVSQSPEERYVDLIREKPGINNRVPDKYLATLLGITPVSLSRIRRRISKG